MIYYFMYRVCWNDYKSSGYVSQFAINGKCDERLFSYFFFQICQNILNGKFAHEISIIVDNISCYCCYVETVGQDVDGLAKKVSGSSYFIVTEYLYL